MTGFRVANIRELVEAFGEDEATKILSKFSCPLNPDVEDYLRHKAIIFSNQGWARTHLVFAQYRQKPELVGYFTLANKHIVIPSRSVNGSIKKRISKFSTFDNALRAYCLAIPLIAQLGKNFSNGLDKQISGGELLKIACKKVNAIQYVLGGRFAYIECEEKPKLIQFYAENGFVEFDRRLRDPDDTLQTGEKMVQMLRMFKGKDIDDYNT